MIQFPGDVYGRSSLKVWQPEQTAQRVTLMQEFSTMGQDRQRTYKLTLRRVCLTI